MCVKVMCVKDLRGHAHGNVVCVWNIYVGLGRGMCLVFSCGELSSGRVEDRLRRVLRRSDMLEG